MRCPYCLKKLGTYDIAYESIDKNDCYINEGNKFDCIYDPDLVLELGFYCGNCGGFLTTDETKVEKILKDNTDDIFQVDENERIEASAKLFNVIRHLNFNRDDFIEGMLKDIFG